MNPAKLLIHVLIPCYFISGINYVSWANRKHSPAMLLLLTMASPYTRFVWNTCSGSGSANSRYFVWVQVQYFTVLDVGVVLSRSGSNSPFRCQSGSGSGKLMPIRPDPDPQHCYFRKEQTGWRRSGGGRIPSFITEIL
jgi:hypothetical protein